MQKIYEKSFHKRKERRKKINIMIVIIEFDGSRKDSNIPFLLFIKDQIR